MVIEVKITISKTKLHRHRSVLNTSGWFHSIQTLVNHPQHENAFYRKESNLLEYMVNIDFVLADDIQTYWL